MYVEYIIWISGERDGSSITRCIHGKWWIPRHEMCISSVDPPVFVSITSAWSFAMSNHHRPGQGCSFRPKPVSYPRIAKVRMQQGSVPPSATAVPLMVPVSAPRGRGRGPYFVTVISSLSPSVRRETLISYSLLCIERSRRHFI